MKKIIYLDTSGINYLANNINDFEAFKYYKHKNSIELYLSSIGLWEILLNSNEEQRDFLIYWAQFNCSNNLLKSPSEILLNYINNDFPQKDKELFLKKPYTEHDIGIRWKNINQNIEKTLILNHEELVARTKPIRELSKKLKTILMDLMDENYVNYENDIFYILMNKLFEKPLLSKVRNIDNEITIKIALILSLFVLCIGIEFENKELRRYWDEKEIIEHLERLEFLVEKCPQLFLRGPLIEMAITAKTQLTMKNSKSRGLVHDSLHSIYCYYSSRFLTSDEHFKELKSNNPDTIFEKILMTEDLNFKI